VGGGRWWRGWWRGKWWTGGVRERSAGGEKLREGGGKERYRKVVVVERRWGGALHTVCEKGAARSNRKKELNKWGRGEEFMWIG
jgi:hypothetical protein